MASFHTWAALLLASAYVVRGATQWHYALYEGPRFALQILASIVVYGALTFLVMRLFALPIWAVRRARKSSGGGLLKLEAALPVALVACGIVTLELGVAWNLDLPQLVALNDPVRTQLVTKGVMVGAVAGLVAGLVALVFGSRLANANTKERPLLLARLAPWLLLATAGVLSLSYSRGLDARGLKLTREAERDLGSEHRRLAVVCLDAAMWSIVDQFVEEGRMPVLAGLRKEGVRGHLVTWGQRLSPVVWTSMVTGMAEQNHGIHGFTEIVGDSLTPTLTRSTSREAAALWNVTKAADTSTLVLNWLVTDPPEPTVGAIIPSLKPTLAGIAPASFPSPLRAGVQSIVDSRPFAREEEAEGSGGAHSGDIVAEEMHLLGTLQEVYEMAAAVDEYALVITGTQTTDGVMHQRMLHAFPEQYDLARWNKDEAELAAGADDLARAYEEADRFLGQLVEDGYTLLIVSDHGSRAQQQPMVTFSLNALLADMGLAHQGDSESGRRRVDTDRSRAFEAGNNALNSEVGLFFQEDVTEDVEALSLQELLSALRELKVEGSGAPLFEGVVDLERKPVFPVLRKQGAAAAVVLGSALRELPEERRIVVGGESRPLARYVQVQAEINGTHEPHGLFLLAGPDVTARGSVDSLCVKTSFGALLSWVIGSKPIATPAWRLARKLGLVCPYTTLDVAPTALAFLGLPIAGDMDGVIMAAALRGTDYSRRAMLTFDSLLSPAGATEGADAEADEAVMDMLRNLGYVR